MDSRARRSGERIGARRAKVSSDLQLSEAVDQEVGMEEIRKWTAACGLPPKSWRKPRMIQIGFPFARNRSLCLQHVLDDAFARFYHNPLEGLLEGFLGLFSHGSRAAERNDLAGKPAAQKANPA